MSASEKNVENEIKIRFPGSAADARKRIESGGYREIQPRTLESDRVFDRDGQLRRSQRLLRLRREGDRALVTFKGPPNPGRYKNREEIEFEVSDAASVALVFERLGYTTAFRYEKYRTTFAADAEPGVVTIDETPMGVFLELEGPPNWVDSTAERLGLTPAQYLTSSYASLYREYRRDNPHVPEDMVFEE